MIALWCAFISDQQLPDIHKAFLTKCQQLNEAKEHNKILYADYIRAMERCRNLEEELQRCRFGYNRMAERATKLHYYTGLNMELFKYVCSLYTKHRVTRILSAEDGLLLIIIRLRLGIDIKDLATRFDISERTAALIFNQGIIALAQELKFLIKWPEHDAWLRNRPEVFRKIFPDVRVIIDCTEILTDRPSSLHARAQMFSTYKHHCTVKFLVAITPNGQICYLSDCWGGRASDKRITLESKLPDLLKYGEQVLADRGFTVSKELAVLGIQVQMPAFTTGKQQLSQADTERSRQMSRLQIHVERIIGRMKKYRLLRTVLPITSLKTVDEAIVVIAALCNLQPKLS